MSIRERIIKKFDDHSGKAVLKSAIVEAVAQNLEINDWHLYPFYSVAFIEGFLSGSKRKLSGSELALAHAYWQAILDERLATRKVTSENNAKALVNSIRTQYGF